MHFFIALEWGEDCGIKLLEMYPFREGIEAYFKDKYYGESLTSIRIILNALGYDVKQRKRYKKDLKQLDYDILFDFFLIKNVPKEEKRKIIRRQFIEITEQVLSKYKFEDFDKATFFNDLKTVVSTIEW